MSTRQRVAQTIADAVCDAIADYEWQPIGRDIHRVEFRPGCAEVDVTYFEPRSDGGHVEQHATVSAAPLLTSIVNEVLLEHLMPPEN